MVTVIEKEPTTGTAEEANPSIQDSELAHISPPQQYSWRLAMELSPTCSLDRVTSTLNAIFLCLYECLRHKNRCACICTDKV